MTTMTTMTTEAKNYPAKKGLCITLAVFGIFVSLICFMTGIAKFTEDHKIFSGIAGLAFCALSIFIVVKLFSAPRKRAEGINVNITKYFFGTIFCLLAAVLILTTGGYADKPLIADADAMPLNLTAEQAEERANFIATCKQVDAEYLDQPTFSHDERIAVTGLISEIYTSNEEARYGNHILVKINGRKYYASVHGASLDVLEVGKDITLYGNRYGQTILDGKNKHQSINAKWFAVAK